jgi:peptidyl-prolyl isomerase G (cyclophilin G)
MSPSYLALDEIFMIVSLAFFRVHVVFGHVLHGTQIVQDIEALPTDESNRPTTEVVITNCGELIRVVKKKVKASDTKSKDKKAKKLKKVDKPKKKRRRSESGSSPDNSSEESADDEAVDKSKKSKTKEKLKKIFDKLENRSPTPPIKDRGDEFSRKRHRSPVDEKEMSDKPEVDEKKEIGRPHPLVTLHRMEAEEIPDVPPNKFLYRRDPKEEEEEGGNKRKDVRASPVRSRRSGSRDRFRDRGRFDRDIRDRDRRDRPDRDFRDRRESPGRQPNVRGYTKSGRRIKGRGTLVSGWNIEVVFMTRIQNKFKSLDS